MRSIFILATLCLCSGLPQNNFRRSSVENNESLLAKGEEFGTDLRKTNFKADTVHEAERNSSPFADSVIGNIYTDSRRAEFSVKTAGEFIEGRTNETKTTQSSTTISASTSPTPTSTPPTTTSTSPTTTSTPPTTTSTPPTTTSTPPTTTSTPPTTTSTPPTTTSTPSTTTSTPPTTTSTSPTTPSTPSTTPSTPSTTPSTSPTTPLTSPTTPSTQPTKPPPPTEKPNSAGKIGFASLSTFVILVLGQLTFKITFFT